MVQFARTNIKICHKTIFCSERQLTAIASLTNNSVFIKIIICKVFRPQKEVSRSQSASLTTKAVRLGQITPKIAKNTSFSALDGVPTADTGRQPFSDSDKIIQNEFLVLKIGFLDQKVPPHPQKRPNLAKNTQKVAQKLRIL